MTTMITMIMIMIMIMMIIMVMNMTMIIKDVWISSAFWDFSSFPDSTQPGSRMHGALCFFSVRSVVLNGAMSCVLCCVVCYSASCVALCCVLCCVSLPNSASQSGRLVSGRSTRDERQMLPFPLNPPLNSPFPPLNPPEPNLQGGREFMAHYLCLHLWLCRWRNICGARKKYLRSPRRNLQLIVGNISVSPLFVLNIILWTIQM